MEILDKLNKFRNVGRTRRLAISAQVIRCLEIAPRPSPLMPTPRTAEAQNQLGGWRASEAEYSYLNLQ